MLRQVLTDLRDLLTEPKHTDTLTDWSGFVSGEGRTANHSP